MDETIDPKYYTWATSLLGDQEPLEVLARVLNYCYDEELSSSAYGDIKEFGSSRNPIDQEGKTRLFVALGKKDKINARKLVDLIQDRVSIKSRQLSDIQILDSFSFVTVPFEKAEEVIECFQEKGKSPLISHAKKTTKRSKKNKKK
jgi:ATP-dependent RNA helicase DeaD